MRDITGKIYDCKNTKAGSGDLSDKCQGNAKYENNTKAAKYESL
jgi:hypothetical protein